MDERKCRFCGYVWPTVADREDHENYSIEASALRFPWDGKPLCSASEGDD
jgi:hypothetical protein